MSNKDVNDRDLEKVSGGMDPVDIQQDQPTNLTSKDDGPPSSGGNSGGYGDPGINDMQQNNDGGPASGA